MNVNVGSSLSFNVLLILKVGDETFSRTAELTLSPFPGLELNLWVGNGFETFKIDKVLIFEDVQMEKFGIKAILIQPPVERHTHLVGGLIKDGEWKQIR